MCQSSRGSGYFWGILCFSNLLDLKPLFTEQLARLTLHELTLGNAPLALASSDSHTEEARLQFMATLVACSIFKTTFDHSSLIGPHILDFYKILKLSH